MKNETDVHMTETKQPSSRENINTFTQVLYECTLTHKNERNIVEYAKK